MRWVPMIRANGGKPPAALVQALSADPQQLAAFLAEKEHTTYWINDVYQVARIEQPDGLIHLNIRRRDGKPIFRDWRHFQQIKNELLGEECEAVELYPAESRKVDSNNKYHLYGLPDPKERFGFGWPERDVRDKVDGAPPGMKQRRL